MAISFSRPDPSSPAAVGSASFPVVRRGFDQGEIRDFLRMVAAELARLQERERFLENELRAMQTRGMSAPGRLDEETVTTLLGEEAARVLSTARDASTQIRERAEESATRLVKEAAEDASRIREAAMLEAARIRDDAAADAEAEIDMAKQQGRDMVNEAREYREKVLSELSRRRDAARAQIEQLLHGRDRLLNAFQRARIATDDVIGELTDAHDEPEFIIDLAPTTGPVPVINPAHPSATGKARVFDREAEDSEPVRGNPEVREPNPLIDIPIDEPALTIDHVTGPAMVILTDDPSDTVVEEVIEEVIEEAVEEQVADVDSPHVADIVETGIPEGDGAPEATAQQDPDGAADGAQSNVVSLFGRNRKPTSVPEIHPVHDRSEPTEADEPRTHKTAANLDDIFSKLRSSTVADVVEKSGGTPTEGKPDRTSAEEKPSEPAPAPAVVASDPAVFSRRDEVVAPLIGSIARHLKRILVDEQNRALGHVATKRSSLEPDAIVGTPEEQAERYSRSVLADAMTIAGAGAKDAGGSTRRISADHIVAEIAGVVAESIVRDFRHDMDVAVGEAEGNREVLAGLLRDVYRSWKAQKIDSSVEMLAYRAYGSGVLLSLEPGATVSWMVPVGGCCSDCEDNSLAGVQGRDSAFPTGHHSAPAHDRCGCLVWPVRK